MPDTTLLAKALADFEQRHLPEVRKSLASLQPSANSGQDKLLSIIRDICKRDGLNIPDYALAVLLSNITVALAVGKDQES